MGSFTVATALYPAALIWVDAFREGLASAAKDKHVDLVVALSGIESDQAEAVLSPLKSIMDLVFVVVDGSSAAVRARMLTVAHECSSSIIVLADADDQMCPTALDDHAATLDEADISYGDMFVINEKGESSGRRFFDGAAIPQRVENLDPLVRRNFMGLTNTAIRRSALSTVDLAATPDVQAYDWWMFTSLLRQGAVAKQTKEAVTRYRNHASSTLGSPPNPETSKFLARCRIVADHAAQYQD